MDARRVDDVTGTVNEDKKKKMWERPLELIEIPLRTGREWKAPVLLREDETC